VGKSVFSRCWKIKEWRWWRHQLWEVVTNPSTCDWQGAVAHCAVNCDRNDTQGSQCRDSWSLDLQCEWSCPVLVVPKKLNNILNGKYFSTLINTSLWPISWTFWKLSCFHERYILPDSKPYLRADSLNQWSAIFMRERPPSHIDGDEMMFRKACS